MADWHRTALTTVPSSEGVNDPAFQTPSTMSPFGAFEGFGSRLIRLPKALWYGFRAAYAIAAVLTPGKTVSLNPSFPAPASAAASMLLCSSPVAVIW